MKKLDGVGPVDTWPFTQWIIELITKLFIEQPWLHWVCLLFRNYLGKIIYIFKWAFCPWEHQKYQSLAKGLKLNLLKIRATASWTSELPNQPPSQQEYIS